MIITNQSNCHTNIKFETKHTIQLLFTSNRSSTITSTSLSHSQHYHRRTEVAKIIIFSSSNKGIFAFDCNLIISELTVFMSFPFTSKQMCTLYPAGRLIYIAIVSYVLKFMKQRTIQIQYEYKNHDKIERAVIEEITLS